MSDIKSVYVCYTSETKEYEVTSCNSLDQKLPELSYFTNDIDDAIATALAICGENGLEWDRFVYANGQKKKV